MGPRDDLVDHEISTDRISLCIALTPKSRVSHNGNSGPVEKRIDRGHSRQKTKEGREGGKKEKEKKKEKKIKPGE